MAKLICLFLFLLVVASFVFSPCDYYLINWNSRQFPGVRSQMPIWLGESARFVFNDVQTWDEHCVEKTKKVENEKH